MGNNPSDENPSINNNDIGKKTVFEMLEESVEEGDELQNILVQVRKQVDSNNIDENNFKQIHDEILKIKTEQQKRKKYKGLPQGVLNNINTLFYLEKEIYRSLRYAWVFVL